MQSGGKVPYAASKVAQIVVPSQGTWLPVNFRGCIPDDVAVEPHEAYVVAKNKNLPVTHKPFLDKAGSHVQSFLVRLDTGSSTTTITVDLSTFGLSETSYFNLLRK